MKKLFALPLFIGSVMMGQAHFDCSASIHDTEKNLVVKMEAKPFVFQGSVCEPAFDFTNFFYALCFDADHGELKLSIIDTKKDISAEAAGAISSPYVKAKLTGTDLPGFEAQFRCEKKALEKH